ncbi:putative uncharacterized oxidoreductase [Penaeus vannamei]|uniref:Uncharacterized oxidoreductase n=1 Tax=Penaeus vannamei TaxID=6689 RepID=A0A3R7MFJ8_PENVA|nr:putative uncharacterized oxidoreductase [Penaeus vannamei]
MAGLLVWPLHLYLPIVSLSVSLWLFYLPYLISLSLSLSFFSLLFLPLRILNSLLSSSSLFLLLPPSPSPSSLLSLFFPLPPSLLFFLFPSRSSLFSSSSLLLFLLLLLPLLFSPLLPSSSLLLFPVTPKLPDLEEAIRQPLTPSFSSTVILVTGVSGYIGSHVAKLLLEEGYKVRGTVRSLSNEAKVEPLKSLVPDAKFPLELVEADLTKEEGWDKAVEGCTGVLHVASPFPDLVNQQVEEAGLVDTAKDGTLQVLKAVAAHAAASVKRVVVTSSFAAVSDRQPPSQPPLTPTHTPHPTHTPTYTLQLSPHPHYNPPPPPHNSPPHNHSPTPSSLFSPPTPTGEPVPEAEKTYTEEDWTDPERITYHLIYHPIRLLPSFLLPFPLPPSFLPHPSPSPSPSSTLSSPPLYLSSSPFSHPPQKPN